MSPSMHNWNMKNLEGSFSVEGITLSEDIKSKLKDVATGKATSDMLVAEIIKKYKSMSQ